MRLTRITFHWCISTLLLLAVFPTAGCDQVGSVVDDVKSSVSGDADKSSDTAAPIEQKSPAATKPPEAKSTQPQPAPEELIAEFLSLKPEHITDSAIARIAESPEAAAAITEIDIRSGNEFTAQGLQQLQAMKNLKSVSLNGSGIQSEQLAALAQISSLTEIKLAATQANDSLIDKLSMLPRLQSLDVSGTTVSPASAAAFAKLQNLAIVDLQNTQIDDSVVEAISALPIVELNLAKTRITDASLSYLAQISTIESLNVSFTAVTGAGFKRNGRMNLRKLNVGETQFGIDGFIAIKGMNQLEELDVYGAGLVEHKSCNVFRSLPKLKILNAGGNAVTDAGMAVFFKGHRSLEELSLRANKGITNQGLSELVGIKTLRLLDVYNTGCSTQGAQALRQKLPECTVLISE